MDKRKNIESELTEEEVIDIQRQRGKYLYDLLFPSENPELENIDKSYEEAVARKPSLEGRLAEVDQKVTLEAYPQECQTRMEVIS